jgi:tRNA-specific 2-thiouridylase
MFIKQQKDGDEEEGGCADVDCCGAESVEDDTVWVTHGDRLAGVAPDRFRVPDPHWITRAPELPDAVGDGARSAAESSRLLVKVRHGPASIGCRVAPDATGGLAVTLDAPDPGLAPGQFAVFYDGELCLGGGAMEPIPRAARTGQVPAESGIM